MVFTFDLGSGFFTADLLCDQIIPDKLVTRKKDPPASNSNLIQCKNSNE
jgi:hypothetical protein